MHFTAVASLGLFAAVASASQHVPQHFHQRRQYNSSVPSTTLTVYATNVYTVTSCAASVTDCPADQSTSEQVITSTVAAYTTVCPIAEAASASSAVLSSYSAAASSTAKGAVSTPAGYPTKPYPTGESGTTPSAPMGTGFTTKGEVIYPTASGSESVVLTYTLGSGTSTTVVTTTIKHTQTATVYATKPGSPEQSGPVIAGVPTSSELTTTITGTSTSTRYITVMPAPSATGSQGIAGSAECVPVTVTVTQATATVTVTAPAYPTTTGANSGDVTTAPGAESYPTESAPNSQIVSLSTATVVPVPYSTGAPYGNATMSTSTKKKCSSVYPSGYVSTGVPSGVAVPTGSYPAYPSGAASPSAGYPGYPSGAAVPSSSTTAEGAATTPAGYPSVAGYPSAAATPSTTSTAEGVVSSPAPAAYPTY